MAKSKTDPRAIAIASALSIERANEITNAMAEHGIGPDPLTFVGLVRIVQFIAEVNGYDLIKTLSGVAAPERKAASIGFCPPLDESKPKD